MGHWLAAVANLQQLYPVVDGQPASESLAGDRVHAVQLLQVSHRLSEEVKQRYPKKLQMFSQLQPSNTDMVDAVDQLSKVAATYEMNEERLIAQWRLFRQTCGCQSDISLSANYLKVPRKHEALQAAYQILLTLSVTSVSVERSFSKLSYIKSKLRTTSQERLEALMLCAVEKDLLKALPTAGLVAQFAAGADHRLDLG